MIFYDTFELSRFGQCCCQCQCSIPNKEMRLFDNKIVRLLQFPILFVFSFNSKGFKPTRNSYRHFVVKRVRNNDAGFPQSFRVQRNDWLKLETSRLVCNFSKTAFRCQMI